MKKSSLSPSPRGFLLTARSNDGDSQRVTVPDAAGSAAASTAGGLVGASAPTFEVAGRCMRGLALAACPELGPRRMQKSSMSPSPRSPRGFLLTPRSQRRGQSASDSPRCCGQRGGFNSRGTGAKGACPGLGPRICKIVAITVAAGFFADAAVQRRGQSASDSPPVTAHYGVIEEATLPVRRVTRAGRHKKARRCRGEERVGKPVAEPRRQRLAWKLDGVIAPWPTSAEACWRQSFNTTTNPRPQRP